MTKTIMCKRNAAFVYASNILLAALCFIALPQDFSEGNWLSSVSTIPLSAEQTESSVCISPQPVTVTFQTGTSDMMNRPPKPYS